MGFAVLERSTLSAAERIQYEGYLRREDTNAAIFRQAETGISIKEIVRLTGHSRGLVRKVLRGQRTDVFRVRESSLERHLPWLDAQPWVERYAYFGVYNDMLLSNDKINVVGQTFSTL